MDLFRPLALTLCPGESLLPVQEVAANIGDTTVNLLEADFRLLPVITEFIVIHMVNVPASVPNEGAAVR